MQYSEIKKAVNYLFVVCLLSLKHPWFYYYVNTVLFVLMFLSVVLNVNIVSNKLVYQ